MGYPAFFDDAPRLVVRDPLSAFLGATEDGIVEYCYLDAVKLAGHSCPTVAGAYLMTLRALGSLYGEALPVRGDIDVLVRDEADEGVAGVMANVAGLLTGAAGEGGFKGIAGRLARRGLLTFGADLDGEMGFRRRDSGAGVAAALNGAVVPPAPEARALLERVLSGRAAPQEAAAFRDVWQDRVRRMLVEHAEDPDLVSLRPLPSDGR